MSCVTANMLEYIGSNTFFYVKQMAWCSNEVTLLPVTPYNIICT